MSVGPKQSVSQMSPYYLFGEALEKKRRVVPKNVLREKLKAQNKWIMLHTSGQNNKWLLNMLAFCSSERLK